MAAKKSFLLRINPELYDALERWAADEFRSVNSHIEFLLRESARKAGRLAAARRPAVEEKDKDSSVDNES